MRITLAAPFEDNPAEATIEVDDATGNLLIHEGRARHSEKGAHLTKSPASQRGNTAPSTPTPADADQQKEA